MKIVADRRIPGLEEALLNRRNHSVATLEGAAISAADVKDADVLFVRTRTRCDASLLSGSRVKLIGTATIGTDHIDVDWCRANGIGVVNAPGCNAPAVMQYVASTLHAAGFDPASHTLGVVGKGSIGSLVTALYREAGTRVLVCDPPRKDAGHTDEDYLPLKDLLARCDAVTLHVPYTVQGSYPTRSLLQGNLPENVKFVVNASRGGVLDSDIVDASRRFIIDTWPFEEEEPALWTPGRRRELVSAAFISTPHIAGYSIEGKARATEAMLAALAHFEAGIISEPKNLTSSLRYSLSDVISSFDPLPLSTALKDSPSSFESLRSSHLRPEPKPMHNCGRSFCPWHRAPA